MLGLTQLAVVVLVLAPDGAGGTWTLSRFLSASGLALWLALAVAVLLCKLRAPISRLPPPRAPARCWRWRWRQPWRWPGPG